MEDSEERDAVLRMRNSAEAETGDGDAMGCGSKRPSGGGAQHLRQVRFRQEEQERKEEMLRDKQSVLEHGRHPYGVQPMGNMYASATPSIRPGLGWFGLLGDQAVLDLLEMLDAQQLGLLTCCSRVLYVFCHHDEVWRSLVLRLFGGQFEFKRSWKDTLGYAVRKAQYIPHLPREIAGVYSDLLFQPWLCSSMGICHEWLERSNIPRRSNLSVQEFIDEFEAPNRPVIITDAMSDWPAMHKWTKEALLSKYGAVTFAAGSVDMRLDAFCRYSDAVQEERPLYLFDKNFTTKCPDLAEDYWIPAYFTHDLFSVLGTERPDWRWLIIGPARSGSAFHVDPNQTSAWNAVITGRKKWIMWPPHYHPPGVWPSEDGSTTTSNASITEWFLNWYPQTQTEAVRPLECVQEAGELIFVPRGWWHCVLNLEPCIAVTQNYVSEQNVLQVLDYMRQSPQCVSGVPSHRRPLLLSQFTQALKRDRPGLIERLEAKRDRHKVPAVSLWDNLVPAQELKSGAASSFTFSFGE